MKLQEAGRKAKADWISFLYTATLNESELEVKEEFSIVVCGAVAQLARAHGSYPWCREFESPLRYFFIAFLCFVGINTGFFYIIRNRVSYCKTPR